jgi:hypothetical protein
MGLLSSNLLNLELPKFTLAEKLVPGLALLSLLWLQLSIKDLF